HVFTTIGTYNVRLFLYNTCGGTIDILQQQVFVGGALTNNVSDFSICTGKSLTLTAAGSTSYSWSTGATTNSIVVSPTVNTTYSLSYTDSFGCLRKSAQTITVNPLPTVTVSGNYTVCETVVLTIKAGGAVTYSWN